MTYPSWNRRLVRTVLLCLTLRTTQNDATFMLAAAYTPASNPRYRNSVARFSTSAPPTSVSTENENETNSADRTTSHVWSFRGQECFSEVTVPDPSIFETTNLAEKTGKFLFGGDSDYIANKRKKDNRPSIVLIHGFGCSTTYWRETKKALESAGYAVHALDLLGQGKSAKPGRADDIEYSIALWAEQVDAYCEEFIPDNQGIVLMGNSLGSLVALTAATGDAVTSSTLPSRIQGIGMFNCGVGMNTRNLLKDPALNEYQKIIFRSLFDVFDNLIFKNEGLLKYILENVVTKDVLRNALTSLYQSAPNPKLRVDDELVDSFYYPAKEAGSPEALSQIYTNDAGRTPMELHDSYEEWLQKIPIHLVWGTEDTVTPLNGVVGQFYVRLMQAGQSPVSMSLVDGGHVPFDELPESNEFMVQWLENVVSMEIDGPPNNRKKRLGLFKW